MLGPTKGINGIMPVAERNHITLATAFNASPNASFTVTVHLFAGPFERQSVAPSARIFGGQALYLVHKVAYPCLLSIGLLGRAYD